MDVLTVRRKCKVKLATPNARMKIMDQLIDMCPTLH